MKREREKVQEGRKLCPVKFGLRLILEVEGSHLLEAKLLMYCIKNKLH